MLSLPFALSLVGLVPGALLMAAAALMSAFGLYLLAKASYVVCDRTGSFATLSAATYPRLAPVFDLAVALKCTGVAIGYLKIVGDLLPATVRGLVPVAAGAAPWYLGRLLWVTAVVVAIAPVTFMRRMDSLKYTSFLGLLSVAYLLGLSAVLWVRAAGATGRLLGHCRLVVPVRLGSLRAFPIMVFAFTCHQNLFPIQNEARDNSPRAFARIINLCCGASLAVYLLFATGSYAAYGGTAIDSNIINNYPTAGAAFILARFLYIFLLTFSYPMVTHPTRESICKILQFFAPDWHRAHRRPVHVAVTLAVLLVTWLVACVNPPLDFVLGLIGSTAAPVICFFLPAIFWLRIDPAPGRAGVLRVGSVALIVFAVCSTALSLTALIVSVVRPA